MPSDAERAAWRTQNADLVEYIQVPANQRASRFLSSMARSLDHYGSLTEAQTRAARNVMRELSGVEGVSVDDPNQPALADESVHIPNGTFTINDGIEHLTYKIHTVRRGGLAGKRVIKRQLAYGEFKAFAFLTRQGQVKVWRTFYEDEAANERYIVWARILLTALNERFSDGYSGTEDEFEFTYAVDSGYTIQASVLCRRCNRNLTDPTSISLGIGPECRNLEQGPRTTAANAHEQVDVPGFGAAARQAGESMQRLGDQIRFLGEPPTMDHLAHADELTREADQVLSVTPALTEAQQRYQAQLIARCEQARTARNQRGIYGFMACEYCGRNNFQSSQGRGRHISSCRRTNQRTMWDRAVRNLGEYRERESITIQDEYSQAYDRVQGRPITRATPVTPVRARRRMPAYSTSVPPAQPRQPNLSALGTVFNGEVWPQ